jgi:hypothetical protein
MQPGPYTPGEIADSVPGRMLRLSEFEDRLSYLVDLQKLIGRIRVDHAPRPHQDPLRSRINPHHHPRRRPARSLLRDRHWNGRDTTRPVFAETRTTSEILAVASTATVAMLGD